MTLVFYVTLFLILMYIYKRREITLESAFFMSEQERKKIFVQIAVFLKSIQWKRFEQQKRMKSVNQIKMFF